MYGDPDKISSTPPKRQKSRLLVQQSLHDYLDNKNPNSCDWEYDNFNYYSSPGMVADEQCNFDAWTYYKCTNEFLQVSRKFTDIYPGSILRSRYLSQVLNGGPQTSQVSIKPGTNFTNPKIRIYSSTSSTYHSVKYDFASVSQKISQTIVSANQDQQIIYFKMGTTDELPDFVKTLNFNPALIKALGISTNYWAYNGNIANFKKKYILAFTKPIATYQVQIKSYLKGLEDSPLNTFFTPKMTLNEYLSRQNYNGWWDYYNPPVYIDSVTYGTMVIITVDFNKITSDLYSQLKDELENSDQAQAILKKMLLQPSVNVFTRGPLDQLELSTLKNSNWFDWMISVPNSASNKVLQPMIYSVVDFSKRNYGSTINLNYVKVCAS